MLINNIDTEVFSAILLDRKIENAEIITYDDWIDNRFEPSVEEQVFKYVNITCNFIIECKNDEEAEIEISNLIRQSSIAELEFIDINRRYKGKVTEHNKEKIISGKYMLDLKWSCGHGWGDVSKKVFDRLFATTVMNKGNIKTPAVLEITPSISVVSAEITGLGEDIIIKNLTAGQAVIIDGELGVVTENGENKWLDYHSWGFPKLKPGRNDIVVDTDTLDIVIKHKPRWI